MKGLQVNCLYFLLLNAVLYVTSLEEDHSVHTLANNIPLENLHLIGYSLGAHVAGFAGSHVSNKVGRITGLDPAGPDFEGEHAHRRLSPDDAHFVDVLHTFTQGSLGFSIGIQQSVGHVDIYPMEAASSQAAICKAPYPNMVSLPSLTFPDVPMSVPSTSSSTACLNAECASVAARTTVTVWATNTRKIRKTCSTKMYTKTRDSMPFRVYHYQLKIHFSSKVDRSEMEPSLAVSPIGTKELTSGTTNTERMEQRRNALLPLPKHLENIFIQL